MKLTSLGMKPIPIIMDQTNESWEAACKLEEEWITRYKNVGLKLVNSRPRGGYLNAISLPCINPELIEE